MPKFIRYSLSVVLLCATIIYGCKTAQPLNTDNPDQYFTVSLYSYGTGIQGEAKNIVVNTIQAYTKKGYTITYNAVPWGKEGEMDYCFLLQKLPPEVYKAFFNELSELLKDKQVHITEKAPCKSNY